MKFWGINTGIILKSTWHVWLTVDCRALQLPISLQKHWDRDRIPTALSAVKLQHKLSLLQWQTVCFYFEGMISRLLYSCFIFAFDASVAVLSRLDLRLCDILFRRGGVIIASAGLFSLFCVDLMSGDDIFIWTIYRFILFIYRPRWAALDSPAPNTPCAHSTSSMLWVSCRIYHMDNYVAVLSMDTIFMYSMNV